MRGHSEEAAVWMETWGCRDLELTVTRAARKSVPDV